MKPACLLHPCTPPTVHAAPLRADAGGTGRNDSKSMNARWEKLQQGEGLAKGGGGGGGVNSGAFIAAGAVALAALAGLYAVLNSAYSLN